MLIIDHIGIVVKSLEEGVEYWKTVFNYEQLTKAVVNTRQKVKVVFLIKKDSLQVKLIEPTDTTSPVYAFAQRGGGLHHLCFKCSNLEREISRLSNFGLRLLTEPQPGEAFEHEKIAFLFTKQGINIELVDTNKRSGLIKSCQ